MKFEIGRFYTHKHMLDACFLVLDKSPRPSNNHDCYMRVRWYTKSGLDLCEIDDVRVKAKQFNQWREVK